MTLTVDDVARALPANLKSTVTDELVDTLNNIAADPTVAEAIRNNFVSYTGVLRGEGRFKTEDYLRAVMYVSYKLMGFTNKDAYLRTFPDRYKRMLTAGMPEKDINGMISAYARGKLVNLIMEQSLVPTWVLNQDVYQKAINVQASIMNDDNVSAKVRVEAANSILTHLKKPEKQNFQIDMKLEDSSGMNELKETLKQLAQTQRDLIEGGITAKQIAAQPLIEGEFKES